MDLVNVNNVRVFTDHSFLRIHERVTPERNPMSVKNVGKPSLGI